ADIEMGLMQALGHGEHGEQHADDAGHPRHDDQRLPEPLPQIAEIQSRDDGDLAQHLLVSRFRNSHDLYIRLRTNFGIEGHWQIIDSQCRLVSTYAPRSISIIWRTSNRETRRAPTGPRRY